MCVILSSDCAADEHSEAFDLWYPQDSSGCTSESLHNELRDCSMLRSPLQADTTPIGTVLLSNSKHPLSETLTFLKLSPS